LRLAVILQLSLHHLVPTLDAMYSAPHSLQVAGCSLRCALGAGARR